MFNVLFICSGNSARSIMAESILRQDGNGRFQAFSAGCHPKGEVDPMTLKVLAATGYPTADLRSKDWHKFEGAGAPAMDFVFTVCDQAAVEAAPVWPGTPMTAHWGISDPANVTGNDLDRERAFVTVLGQMRRRIAAFIALSDEALQHATVSAKLHAIGTITESASS
ncbi:MAG TPA: arsenate reductase ArsC [Stellaceae bacterium]|nr:arsenate reductase ArsC [Stellaceae bacterium]